MFVCKSQRVKSSLPGRRDFCYWLWIYFGGLFCVIWIILLFAIQFRSFGFLSNLVFFLSRLVNKLIKLVVPGTYYYHYPVRNRTLVGFLQNIQFTFSHHHCNCNSSSLLVIRSPSNTTAEINLLPRFASPTERSSSSSFFHTASSASVTEKKRK